MNQKSLDQQEFEDLIASHIKKRRREHEAIIKKAKWQLPLLTVVSLLVIWEGITMTVGKALLKALGSR